MKKVIIILISILVVILLLVSLYFYGLTSVSKNSEVVNFNIEKGTSTKEIIDNLYEAKLIKSKIASMIYVKLQRNIIIQAGNYELDRAYNTKEIFNILNGGKVRNDTVKITFVEGKRIVDYIPLITDKFNISEDEILNTLKDQDYLKELIKTYDMLDESILESKLYYSLEGYLFPDTYEFYPDASIKDIFAKMLDKSQDVLDNYSAALSKSNYSIHEILTMASIIENETMFKEDRSIVSQVIYKRLAMNMSLGMDVTAYYGARKALSETLTESDLNNDNAYNTRNTSFIGLPVGPICNPSIYSIEAALNPSTDTDYVYFYADKEGKLHFAKTHSEFQDLIRIYG